MNSKELEGEVEHVYSHTWHTGKSTNLQIGGHYILSK